MNNRPSGDRQAATAAASGRWALAALLAGAVAIGFVPIFVRLSETGPVATGFWRMALSLPLLILWLRMEGRRVATGQGLAGIGWLIGAGILFAIDLGFWHWSIQLTSVANSTFLVNLAPVAIGLGAWLFFREHLRTAYFAGLMLAVLGGGLLMRASLGPDSGTLLGDSLALFAALFYAGYQLVVKHLRREHSTARILVVSSAVTACVLLISALAMGETMLPQTAQGWLVLAGVAVICHVGGVSLIIYAMAHLPAALSSLSLLVQPVAASLFAWLMFGEHLEPLQWLGGSGVLAGIWLASRGTGERA